MQMKRIRMRYRELPLLAFFLVVVGLFLWIDQRNLPDYESYERIYRESSLGEGWEIFFIAVNFLFRESGFSYTDFRDFILIFSSLALWVLLSRIQRLYHFQPVSVAYILLIFFVTTMLIFEYFVIRIRAGFAMGLIFFAVFFLLSTRVWLVRFLAVPLLLLAFFTHKTTSLILIIFLMFPFVAGLSKWPLRNKNSIYLFLSIVTVSCLLYALNSSYELRGEHIHSPLNPVRFAMISGIPIALTFLVKNESSGYQKCLGSVPEFSFFFIRFYIILALGLAFMFFLGLTGESGEALVRLYTLSSIPSLLSLQLSGSIIRAPVSAYILLINALFFLNTVLFSGNVD